MQSGYGTGETVSMATETRQGTVTNPSVVINEPADEALVQWLKQCRVDQETIDKVGLSGVLLNCWETN